MGSLRSEDEKPHGELGKAWINHCPLINQCYQGGEPNPNLTLL